MPGLPKQFAFKKGWKMFKSRGGKIHGEFLGGKKRGRKRRSHYIGGDISLPALVQRPVKNFSKITPQKILSPVIDLGLLILGMTLGAGIKRAVPIKNPHLMNGVQTLAGIGGSLVTRNRFVKMPLIGVALQSAISEAKILMPKMLPLAGDDEVVYIPTSGDEEEPAQLVYQGDDGQYYPVPESVGQEDERVGAVYDGDETILLPSETVGQDEERVGAVYDGDETDDMMGGEGSNN
jgi:hypothetical protein